MPSNSSSRVPLFPWSLLALCFVTAAFSADGAGDEALARRCIGLLEQGRFAEAAQLFHYPADYDVIELENDRYQVTRNLHDLAAEFGALHDATLAQDGQHILRELGTRAGDYAYWRDRPDGRAVYFRTRFERAGQGFVKVSLVDFAGRLEIGGVSFGIPAQRADAAAWIQDAKGHLLRARRERPPPPALAGV